MALYFTAFWSQDRYCKGGVIGKGQCGIDGECGQFRRTALARGAHDHFSNFDTKIEHSTLGLSLTLAILMSQQAFIAKICLRASPVS